MYGTRKPMRHLRIKNWPQFQHYDPSRAEPGWVKFYNYVLIDPDFRALSDAAKLTLQHIWLLGSTVILKDREERDPWIAEPWLNSHDLGVSCKPRIAELVTAGYVFWESREPSRPFTRRSPKKPRQIPFSSRASSALKDSSLDPIQSGESEGVRQIRAALDRHAPQFVAADDHLAAAADAFGAPWVSALIAEPDVCRHLTKDKTYAYLLAILNSRRANGWQPTAQASAGYVEPVRQGVTVDDARQLKWELAQEEWTREESREMVAAYLEAIVRDGALIPNSPTLTEWLKVTA